MACAESLPGLLLDRPTAELALRSSNGGPPSLCMVQASWQGAQAYSDSPQPLQHPAQQQIPAQQIPSHHAARPQPYHAPHDAHQHVLSYPEASQRYAQQPQDDRRWAPGHAQCNADRQAQVGSAWGSYMPRAAQPMQQDAGPIHLGPGMHDAHAHPGYMRCPGQTHPSVRRQHDRVHYSPTSATHFHQLPPSPPGQPAGPWEAPAHQHAAVPIRHPGNAHADREPILYSPAHAPPRHVRGTRTQAHSAARPPAEPYEEVTGADTAQQQLPHLQHHAARAHRGFQPLWQDAADEPDEEQLDDWHASRQSGHAGYMDTAGPRARQANKPTAFEQVIHLAASNCVLRTEYCAGIKPTVDVQRPCQCYYTMAEHP